jgi:hypothetical protein
MLIATCANVVFPVWITIFFSILNHKREEFRSQKSGVRSQESGGRRRGKESGVRSQESGVRRKKKREGVKVSVSFVFHSSA